MLDDVKALSSHHHPPCSPDKAFGFLDSNMSSGASTSSSSSEHDASPPWTLARLSTEQRTAFRRATAPMHPAGQRQEAVPRSMAIFRTYFPGRFSFFVELASYRLTAPRVTVAVGRVVEDFINVLAHMRTATVLPAAQCEWCRSVGAPFCARGGHVHPAGAKQHNNSRSNKCLLARAFNAIQPSPDRILSLLSAPHDGQLRLVRDTDDQAATMHMLPKYTLALWKFAHASGVQRLLEAVHIVLDTHGIPPSPSSHHRRGAAGLRRGFAQLVGSVQRYGELGVQIESEEVEGIVEGLAGPHGRLWGGDYADFAMQALLLLWKDVAPAAVPCPREWLHEQASIVHAEYPPEEYRCDGRTLRVSRDHAVAQAWLDRWLQSHLLTSEPHDDDDEEEEGGGYESDESAGPVGPGLRARTQRRWDLDSTNDDDDDDGQDGAGHGGYDANFADEGMQAAPTDFTSQHDANGDDHDWIADDSRGTTPYDPMDAPTSPAARADRVDRIDFALSATDAGPRPREQERSEEQQRRETPEPQEALERRGGRGGLEGRVRWLVVWLILVVGLGWAQYVLLAQRRRRDEEHMRSRARLAVLKGLQLDDLVP